MLSEPQKTEETIGLREETLCEEVGRRCFQAGCWAFSSASIEPCCARVVACGNVLRLFCLVSGNPHKIVGCIEGVSHERNVPHSEYDGRVVICRIASHVYFVGACAKSVAAEFSRLDIPRGRPQLA